MQGSNRLSSIDQNFKIYNTYTMILLVSRSTHMTSMGGSWRSKKRESTPIRKGSGACSTSARPSGHNGIYGHCHLNGNIIIETASATPVSTSGLSEWISNFCSVSAHSNTTRQFSGARFTRSFEKRAPLRGRGRSSGCVRIKRCSGESCSNS